MISESISSRICIPIFGSTPESMINTLAEVPEQCSCVEFRLDSLSKLSFPSIEMLLNAWTKQAIMTCRLPNDGGSYRGDLVTRNEVLQQTLELRRCLVDIEHEQCSHDAFSLSNYAEHLIVSHHNFDAPYTRQEIDSLLHAMRVQNAVHYKIATVIHAPEDRHALYQSLLGHAEDPCLPQANGRPLILVGMGERGRETRILGPLLGSAVSFAEPLGNASALSLGQIAATRMFELYATLEATLETNHQNQD